MESFYNQVQSQFPERISAEPVVRDPDTGRILLCRTLGGDGWVLVDTGTTAFWEKKTVVQSEKK